MSHLPGLNRWPARYECAALPTELRWHIINDILTNFSTPGKHFDQ